MRPEITQAWQELVQQELLRLGLLGWLLQGQLESARWQPVQQAEQGPDRLERQPGFPDELGPRNDPWQGWQEGWSEQEHNRWRERTATRQQTSS